MLRSQECYLRGTGHGSRYGVKLTTLEVLVHLLWANSDGSWSIGVDEALALLVDGLDADGNQVVLIRGVVDGGSGEVVLIRDALGIDDGLIGLAGLGGDVLSRHDDN